MGALPKQLSMTRFLGFVFFISHVSIMGIAGEMHNPKTGKLAGAEGHYAEGSVKIEGHRLVLSNISVDKVRDGRVYEMSGL